jgi:hypothetical protein
MKRLHVFIPLVLTAVVVGAALIMGGGTFGASRWSPGGGSPLSPGLFTLTGTVISPSDPSHTIALPASVFYALDGDETLPGYAFDAANDAGMYRYAAGTSAYSSEQELGFSIDGISVGFFTPNHLYLNAIDLTPWNNNQNDLGSGAKSWKNVYASGTGAFTGGLALGATANITVGGANAKRTIILTGAGALQSTTRGATSTKWEMTTNKQNYYAPEFSSSTTGYVEWTVVMPGNYDGGTVTANFHWMSTTTATTFATWGIQAVAIGDGASGDATWGTAVTTTDANTGANYVNVSATSSPVTIGGTPTGNRVVQFRVYRDKDATGGDTLGVVAKLLAVYLNYGISRYGD